ncbi:DNA cytosine methyltransferase [Microbacterium testaceum]|uniref:DNA (cytosine-5-)-methyltransferase n=1 Tax=Microbacterium testaceum TaxID=2033 RepID=A0A147F4R7_MICTE|nr:DNA cytosine methyltransferase [Microbacterium testaceum]KTS09059.1 hypothetical protein RSA3_14260 [Microbacterium testaceum]
MSAGELRALDLFAGTGWGVALQARGIREGGVEIMPEAQASRAAAGMETTYSDVWDGLLGDNPHRFWHALQIASPPCQSFSLAGKGAGRAALDDVLRAIDEGAYRRPERLRALGADTDDRTALVLTPLAHVFRDRPLWVTWEQVPPVLPVWEACAEVLRGMGYSVWVGIIRAEQYGVPQTRRRAVLIARADGIDAAPPEPTHSRYYETEPERLDMGVLPWVSMADAIGWGMAQRPAPTITGGGTETGGAEPIAKLARYTSRDDWTARTGAMPICTPERLAELARWRWWDRPATTIAGDPRITAREHHFHGEQSKTSLRLEPVEAARLQSFPDAFPFAGRRGKQFLQIGNAVPPLMAGAIVDELLAPAALRALPAEVAA